MQMNMIKGAFFLEEITEDIIEQIIASGINEISLKWEHYDNELVNLLRTSNIKVYIEVSLFVSEELWQKYPDSRPLDRDGKLMDPINWYYGVCPNHVKVREEKLSIIARIIETFNFDGLWLDFIRYPCHWEAARDSNITEYCFCKNCLEKFEKDRGGSPEGDAWVAWKCQQITEFVRDVRERVDLSGKNIQLGMFAVPWIGNTCGNAIHSIVCQDFPRLSKYIDVFGVMTYHKLADQSANWIEEVVDKLAKITGKPVVPLVQSIDTPTLISKEDFEHSIGLAVGEPSKGVIIFHFHDLLANQRKYEVVKKLFTTEL
ncbi:hypothetical protein SAMN02745866_01105 [Alteromonadaceae bacterium Bs31]|nr:hypothetical protein SAMN02745866_01105 [Alteromonadaceae bacterium Bs31]